MGLEVGIRKGFFFFKQKAAYEIKYGLVGSEMCMRDGCRATACATARAPAPC